MLKLTMRKKYFDQITSGIKTITGRLNTSEFKEFKVGKDLLLISEESNETLVCEILRINTYKDFKSMLENEGIENMIPGATNMMRE